MLNACIFLAWLVKNQPLYLNQILPLMFHVIKGSNFELGKKGHLKTKERKMFSVIVEPSTHYLPLFTSNLIASLFGKFSVE